MPLSLLSQKVLQNLVKSALIYSQVHVMMDILQLENCILFKISEHCWLS